MSISAEDSRDRSPRGGYERTYRAVVNIRENTAFPNAQKIPQANAVIFVALDKSFFSPIS
jgi:hypothetical protein